VLVGYHGVPERDSCTCLEWRQGAASYGHVLARTHHNRRDIGVVWRLGGGSESEKNEYGRMDLGAQCSQLISLVLPPRPSDIEVPWG